MRMKGVLAIFCTKPRSVAITCKVLGMRIFKILKEITHTNRNKTVILLINLQIETHFSFLGGGFVSLAY